MTEFFLLAMALIMFVGMSGLTFNLWRGGNLKWNRAVSREAKTIASRGMVLGVMGSFVLFGADMVLSVWPYWTAAGVLIWLSYKGLDWLFVRDDDAPRVIQHANGRRAVVDRETYRRVVDDPPQRRG